VENNDALKAPAQSTEQVAGFDAGTGMVESALIAKLRATLLTARQEDMPWPTKKLKKQREVCLAQMVKVFQVLFKTLETRAPLPKTNPKGSAMAIVAGVLAGSKWPSLQDKIFPVAPEYADVNHFKTFRRYEIGCAMQLLYQAYSSQSGGGIRDDYPPKVPPK
jgi:hypothetical protein